MAASGDARYGQPEKVERVPTRLERWADSVNVGRHRDALDMRCPTGIFAPATDSAQRPGIVSAKNASGLWGLSSRNASSTSTETTAQKCHGHGISHARLSVIVQMPVIVSDSGIQAGRPLASSFKFPSFPPPSPKPYLVLRDTLCSCEAYGMRPSTYK